MHKLFNKPTVARVSEVDSKPLVLIKVDSKVLADNIHVLSISSEGASSIQIDNTFDRHMLVTMFGDKITQLVLTCIAIPKGMCKVSGSETMMAFYMRNRAGIRTTGKVPILRISFDGAVFRGVLINIKQSQFELATQAGLNLFQYSLTVAGVFVS